MSESSAQNTGWMKDARFGMFVRWGLYSVPARQVGKNSLAEWIRSRQPLSDEHYNAHFDPDLYDPAVWAREAGNAGMRYFVVTTKHHEGFCLWDSQYTDYKATNTPAGRDLLCPMVDAFRAEGLRVGFYHSLIDWCHPEFPVDPVAKGVNCADGRPARGNPDPAPTSAATGRDIARYRIVPEELTKCSPNRPYMSLSLKGTKEDPYETE